MCQSTFCTTLEIYSFDIGHKGGLQASKKKNVKRRGEDKGRGQIPQRRHHPFFPRCEVEMLVVRFSVGNLNGMRIDGVYIKHI